MGTVWLRTSYYMLKHFLDRWNIIFFVHPVSVAISNKRVIKQFLISHTPKVLPLHLTSFNAGSFWLFLPALPSLLSPPRCGNVIQVWCIHCAWVRFKCSPLNSNQILPSHYLLLHFAWVSCCRQIQSTDLHNYGKGCVRWIGNSVSETTGDKRPMLFSSDPSNHCREGRTLMLPCLQS